MELVFWIFVLKTQHGTKEDFNVNVTLQENMSSMERVKPAKKTKFGMG